MRVTRLGLLQVLGGTAGGAAVVRGRLTQSQQAVEDLGRWATPEEVVVPSICQQCPGGCGLLVCTLDGEAAGISGNPLHPVNRGGLCPKAFGALELFYDSGRLKGPIARAGERGTFHPIDWDGALAMVGAVTGGRLFRESVQNPLDVVTAMWNHAGQMKEKMVEENVAWPVLRGGETADLVAYLLSLRAEPQSLTGHACR